MILLYIYLKRFFLDLKVLSDGKVVTLTEKKKKENGSTVNFWQIITKSLKSISD